MVSSWLPVLLSSKTGWPFLVQQAGQFLAEPQSSLRRKQPKPKKKARGASPVASDACTACFGGMTQSG